jgi:hypothetical protein
MSIAANELRIGNWVNLTKWKGETVTHQIREIVIQDEFKDCSPITLTTEILEKCGFDYKVNGFNHEFRRGKCEGEYLDYLLLNRHEPSSYYKLIHVMGEVVLVDKIYYLHQLQNLYFALTNTELIVNL